MTGVKEGANIIEGFWLSQNFPNPFNPSTKIRFLFNESTKASLRVFDIMGNEISILFNGTAQANKLYEVEFNATKFPSGIYFYKIEGNGRSIIKKMAFLK